MEIKIQPFELVEARLDSHYKEMDALVRLSEKVNSGLMLARVLDEIYELFQPVIPFDRLGVALLSENYETVHVFWTRSEKPATKLVPGYKLETKRTSLGKIIEAGAPRIINDLRQYFVDNPRSESTKLALDEGIRSSLTCPLLAGGRTLGFVFFSSFKPNVYRDIHTFSYLQIAAELSMVIDKALLYEKLIEMKKLKHKVFGMAVHDIRGPLGAAQGFAKLMLSEKLGPLTNMQKESLEQITKSVAVVLNTTNDLLDVSAVEAGYLNLEKVSGDLGVLVRASVQIMAPLAKDKQINIVSDLAAKNARTKFDAHRIHQVMENLLSNAIKYSNPQTTITVNLEIVKGRIQVQVADQGQGIAPEDMKHIFTEFGKTSAVPTGGEKSVGLGLVIVKRIVEAHGGRVWVSSRPGKGATFYFDLPIE